MEIIIGILLGLTSSVLATSLYLYLIYVVPFISDLNNKVLLYRNNLIRIVLTGGFVTALISLAIYIGVLFYNDTTITIWFHRGFLCLSVVFLVDTHIVDKLFKTDKKKRQTILNFKNVIIRYANSEKVKDILLEMERVDTNKFIKNLESKLK